MPETVSSAVAAPVWIWVLLLAAGAVASVPDVREHRIPNWLTLPLLAAGLLYMGVVGGWAGLGDALAGAAVASSVFVVGYLFAGGGAGDAKLMMALGAWLGWEISTVLLVCVLVTGMAGIMIGMCFRGGVRGALATVFNAIGGGLGRLLHLGRSSGADPASAAVSGGPTGRKDGFRRRQQEWFPYAPAILAGTAVAWWYVELFGDLP